MQKLSALAFGLALCALLVTPMVAGEGNVTINGIVTDDSTGLPIAGAHVTAYEEAKDFFYGGSEGVYQPPAIELYEATTSGDGSFSISVAPGRYALQVEAEGYLANYASADATASTSVDVALAKLPPYDAHVTIKVTDSETGLPVSGASVYAWPEVYMMEGAGALGFPSYKEVSGETGADGTFISGIWNGAYSLSIYVEHYFSNFTRFEVSGEDLTVEVPMTSVPPPNSILEGKVVDQRTGQGIAGASVYAYSMYRMGGYYGGYDELDPAVTDTDGLYALKVYGGVMSVSAYTDDYYSYYGSVNVADNSTMSFDIALFPIIEPDRVSTLRGVVSSEGGPASGARVDVTYMPMLYGAEMAPGVYDSGGRESGQVSPTDPGFSTNNGGGYSLPYYGEGSWTWNTTSGADGSFAIAVPMGDLSITAYADGYYPYFGWLYIDGQGTYWQNATLEAIPTPDATIAGTVKDSSADQPIADAYVSAYMVRDPVETYTDTYSERTDEGISTDVSGGDAMPEPGQAPPVGMDMMTPYGYYCAKATTGADGTFTLSVPHGCHVVEVWASGHEYYTSQVEVEEGATLTLEIALGQADENTVYSGDADGRQYVMPVGDGVKSMPSAGGPESITIAPGEEYELSVDDVFTGGSESVTYGYETTENVRVDYDGASGKMTITAPDDWTGTEEVRFRASDGTTTVYHTLDVKVARQSPLLTIVGFAGAIALALAVIAVIWKTQRA
jgi:hypothetical protein